VQADRQSAGQRRLGCGVSSIHPKNLEIAKANYHREFADDPDHCEYFVPVQWLKTVPVAQAIREVGMFGNQNPVCKPSTPKWRATVERLKERFPEFEGHA
jgi:hypothetical protein